MGTLLKALIDGDVLRYEIGYAAETSWKHKHPDKDKEWFESNPPPWAMVEEILEQRITYISVVTQSDSVKMFFTGKGNFRNDIAKQRQYKNRPSNKPFHFKNIEAYLKAVYEYSEQDGLEADDLMAIEQSAQTDRNATIICTRDKDLRAVSGWIYSWELGEIPSFGPHFVTGYGSISISNDKSKITGWGLKFFLSQCITGDTVDSVPGLPRSGPVDAFNLLMGTTTYEEGLEAVLGAYERKFGDKGREMLTEQGRLLWMTRHLVNDKPVLWDTWTTYENT